MIAAVSTQLKFIVLIMCFTIAVQKYTNGTSLKLSNAINIRNTVHTVASDFFPTRLIENQVANR